MRNLSRFFLSIILLVPLYCFSQNQSIYPPEVISILKKAGKNRIELEKSIVHFAKKKDPLELKALYFLISNMDIHFSRDYYWADTTGKRINFNELDYSDLPTALDAFEKIKLKTGKVKPVPFTYKDIDTIKATYLINNIESAFRAWKGNKFKNIPFEVFCEDILPYRVSTEPLQQWREIYEKRYAWLADSAKHKNTEGLLQDASTDFKTWFVNTWDLEQRNEPLPRLGPLQLLSRKKGNCDDIADLQVYTLRSQGYPARLENIPFWATTTGRHFFNSTDNESQENLPFDISTASVKINSFSREPSKVIRITYSKQPGALGNKFPINSIPEGFLRMPNYLDVTNKYWKASDLSVQLFKVSVPQKIAYACVFNGFKWQATWWGNVLSDAVVFKNMCMGAIFLPMYYHNNKLVPAGYPVASGYNHKIVLKPDTVNKQSITLKQQDKYLIFRPEKIYKLYYWNNGWKIIDQKTAVEGNTELVFNNAPKNALFLLIPDYSQGKERPFIISEEGERLWF